MHPRLRLATRLSALLLLSVLTACSSGPPAGNGPTPCGPGQNPPNPCPAQSAAAPTLASITPASAVAGSGGFTLTVEGASFTTSSVVDWNGAPRPTTYVGPTELTATVSATDVGAAGTAQVTVSTPSPGGGISSVVAFTVSAAHQGQTIGVIGVASTDASGQVGHGGSSYQPALSADGRYVAFSSLATDLVAADANGATDVFWHDTCRGAPPGCAISTQLVSLDLSGHQLPNGARVNATIAPGNTITGDGRFALFLAYVGDVLPSHPGVPDFTIELFVRDTCTGQPAACVPSTALVSQDPLGNPANAQVDSATISRDGRVVTFISAATNLVSEVVTYTQLYARETCLGAPSGCTPTNHLVSVSNAGDLANGEVRSAAVSAVGRHVVFESYASNLVAGDHALGDDVFERDTCIGAPPGCTPSTILVSPARAGVTAQSNVYAAFPSVSTDGRFVLFESTATDLIATDTHGSPQVFLRDTCVGASGPCTPTTSLLSAALDGTPADSDNFVNGLTALSGDGRYAAFASDGDNLLPGVTSPACYVRDTCAGAPSGCTPRLGVVSVDAQGNLLPGCGQNGLGGAGVPVLSADGHLGVFERFDQASNGLQAYLVLTGF